MCVTLEPEEPTWKLSYAPIPGVMTKTHGPFRCKPCYRNPDSVRKDSRTVPTKTVQRVVKRGPPSLKRLWQSDKLLDRLKAYVTPPNHELDLQPPTAHAVDCPGAPFTLPSPEMYHALAQIKTLEEYIRIRIPSVLVNISSAQDEVHIQILELMNALIKVRATAFVVFSNSCVVFFEKLQ